MLFFENQYRGGVRGNGGFDFFMLRCARQGMWIYMKENKII